MKRTFLFACLFSLSWLPAAACAEALRRTLPDGQTVVVAPGAGEPASIGSYSIRLYAAANRPAYALDQFQSGLIQPRDGRLQGLRLMALRPAAPRVLVVVMQSAGSGGYLAADAYLAADGQLTMLACVRGLPPQADLRTALRQASSADVSCAP